MQHTTPREADVFSGAVQFTAVRGLAASRIRRECATLEEAESVAREYGDGRTMIYAIDAMGGCAHIKNA